jgi:alkylation response protein AidB-like acyl-CoA dehydrogenase
MQGLYAVGVSGVGLGVAREMLAELVKLATRKTPRGQSCLADQGLVQAEVAHAEARLASAEAYLKAILADIYANADEWGAIGTKDRARVRLGCANAIHGAVEVADSVHKLAGVDAIFPGSPFERRFRDIHTLSQQIQSRSSHFESVGRILLGANDPTFL